MTLSAEAQDLTVIMPTFNRRSTLLLSLEALEAQTCRGFQVIVVDDGSQDNTAEALLSFAQRTSLAFRYFTQPNAGPARARNLALKHTVTPLTLFLGDDIVASPTLIEKHVSFHHSHPEPSQFALGLTRWDEIHQQVTPFMRWYEKFQFAYGLLLQNTPPTWAHAYTSNLSGKTAILRENLFNESFDRAAWEDSELAFRLTKQKQFELTFLPEALADHIHPTTFSDALGRSSTLGRGQRRFHTLHPALALLQERDLTFRVCAALGKSPRMLQYVTFVARKVNSPGKLHSMVLRAHESRAYHQG